jgi:hypothetical protein
LALDQVVPEFMEAAIWSFELGEWPHRSDGNCLYMNGTSGRWWFDSRSEAAMKVCRQVSDTYPHVWTIAWECGDGAVFDLPRTAAENLLIRRLMNDTQVDIVALNHDALPRDE